MKEKIIFGTKIALLTGICMALNYCFFDDIHSYTRYMLKDMYEQKENIDVVFLGASHVYVGIDPFEADKLLDCNTFNASSSSQQYLGSYYMLKEISDANDVGTVFLDTTYIMAGFEEEVDRQTYILSDYMRNGSKNKWDYLIEAKGSNGILNTLFPMIHNSQFPHRVLPGRLSTAYKNYDHSCVRYEEEWYKGKGFVVKDYAVDEGHVFVNEWPMDTDEWMHQHTLSNLCKVIELCRERGIELVLIDCPMPDATLKDAGYYQEYIDYMKQLAYGEKLAYLNFNLSKEEVLKMSRQDYYDNGHMNIHGAQKFTQALCKVYTGKEKHPFYETYKEKLIHNNDGT